MRTNSTPSLEELAKRVEKLEAEVATLKAKQAEVEPIVQQRDMEKNLVVEVARIGEEEAVPESDIERILFVKKQLNNNLK